MEAFFICIAVGGIITFLINVIALCKGEYTPPSNPRTDAEVHVDVHVHEQPKWPSIAEQFDGRLTNIVKDPLEGIL